jgi:hypothetical protein
VSIVDFDTLPDHARVWIFGADRALTDVQTAALHRRMRPFIAQWTAHSARLASGYALWLDRFLVVAVDEALALASGCSIDALTREIRALEEETKATWLDGTRVWHRDRDGAIHCVSRPELKRLAADGRVSTDTIFFDHTLRTLGELRTGRFELPARDSWHSQLLARAVTDAGGAASGAAGKTRETLSADA